MSRRACGDGDHDDEPRQLEVAHCSLHERTEDDRPGSRHTGELVNQRDIAIAKHDNPRCQKIEPLVRHKGHPRLQHKVGLVDGDQGHEVGCVDQIR